MPRQLWLQTTHKLNYMPGMIMNLDMPAELWIFCAIYASKIGTEYLDEQRA